MRTEQQMFDLILGVAKNDDRIRAVMLNGSRANVNAPKDIFQDFDIIYFVTELESFTTNHDWVNVFDERIIMQMPDTFGDARNLPCERFAYLMQFSDGNRIDLTLIHTIKALNHSDSLSVVLIDKDNMFGELPPPNNSDYLTKPPKQKGFDECCNEFWWVALYVAKGIWRDELPYAMSMFNGPVRDMLHKMLEWNIGINTNFSVSAGKCGKYFKKYLRPELWEKYKSTYSDSDYDNLWQAVFVAADLFSECAHMVAQYFDFSYNHDEEKRAVEHLRHVQKLPPAKPVLNSKETEFITASASCLRPAINESRAGF